MASNPKSSLSDHPVVVAIAVIAGIATICGFCILSYTFLSSILSPAASPTPPQLATDLPAVETNEPFLSPTDTDEPPPAPTERNEPPLGEGGIIRGNGLSIQLVEYRVYSQSDSENAAAYYQLAFLNETGITIEVMFKHSDISAVDNTGVNYGDYYDVLKKWYDTSGSYGCICVTCGTPEYPVTQEFSVTASSTHMVDLFLLTADTVGNCGTWDAQKSRVTFDTNYINLRLATVQYRTDQLYEISDLRWRLNR